MPHYFFDVDDGETATQDAVGIPFETREQARIEAMRSLPELASYLLPNGELRAFTVRIREDGDNPIFEAKLLFVSKWLD